MTRFPRHARACVCIAAAFATLIVALPAMADEAGKISSCRERTFIVPLSTVVDASGPLKPHCAPHAKVADLSNRASGPIDAVRFEHGKNS